MQRIKNTKVAPSFILIGASNDNQNLLCDAQFMIDREFEIRRRERRDREYKRCIIFYYTSVRSKREQENLTYSYILFPGI
jgi:hypothetical protein